MTFILFHPHSCIHFNVSVVSWMDEVYLLKHSSGMAHEGTIPRDLVYVIFLCKLVRKKKLAVYKILGSQFYLVSFFFFFNVNPFLKHLCLQTHVLEHGQWLDGICYLYFHLKENWIEDTLSLLCILITHIFSFIFHSFLGGVTEDMLQDLYPYHHYYLNHLLLL